MGLGACELGEPVKLELGNGADNEERKQDTHPCPRIEVREERFEAAWSTDVSLCFWPKECDEEQWDHGEPDDHAPGAERAENKDALIRKPEN